MCTGLPFRLRIFRRLLLWFAMPLLAAAATGVGSQDLRVTLGPACAMTTPGMASLTHGQTAFQPFQATVPLNYEVRTTPAGSGKITLQVSANFTPAGGPSVADGVLTYTCGAASLGTGCSGAQTASMAMQTPVLTLPGSACTGGGGVCSSQDPNSVNVTFTLIDDPGYATGVYAANVTFTISAI
jgi:hypothetical protein